jgi:hypothetical protein
MTTIAYRAGILAGDRQVNFDTINDCQITKVVRTPGGVLVGASGSTSMCRAIRQWFMGGEAGERPAFKVNDESASALVIRPDGSIEYHDVIGWHEIGAEFYAIGSGYTIALGAMAMGANAEDAVKVASRFCTKTGDKVDTVALEHCPA